VRTEKRIEFFSTYAITFTEKAKKVKTNDDFEMLTILIILASGARIMLFSKKRKRNASK